MKTFFSLLLDGSTDTGNIDNELVWFDGSEMSGVTLAIEWYVSWSILLGYT